MASILARGARPKNVLDRAVVEQPQYTHDQLVSATNNEMQKGFRSAQRGATAAAISADGLNAEIAGDPVAAQMAYEQADMLRKAAVDSAPRVQSLRDIHSVGDTVDFIAGGVPQAATSTLPVVAGALAGKVGGLAIANRAGLAAGAASRAGTAGSFAGGAQQAYGMEYNETAGELAQDPEARARMSAQEISDVARNKALINMGLESIGPSMAVDKLLGNAAKGSVLKAGRNAMIGEGATEGVQQAVGDVSANYARTGEVDVLSPDEQSIADSVALGAMGGTSLAAPAMAGTAVANAGGTIADMGSAAYNKARELAGSPQAAELKAKAQNASMPTAEQAGAAVGKAASKVMDAKESVLDHIKNKVVKGASPELDALLAKQTGATPDEILADDAVRNEHARTLAQRYMADPEAPASLRQAAETMLGDQRTEAWTDFGGAVRQHEAAKKFGDNLDNIGAAFETAGLTLGKAASDFKAGVDTGRRANAEEVNDGFGDLFAKTMTSLVSPRADANALEKVAKIAPAIQQWIANGFAATAEGKMYVPHELSRLGKDPIATVKALHELMSRQGLLNKFSEPRLKVVTKVMEERLDAGALIENNLLPTAQAQFGFSGADHRDIAAKIESKIVDGTLNVEELKVLFGNNTDRVLSAIEKTADLTRGEKQEDDRVVKESDGQNSDDAEQSTSFEELNGMTNGSDPNTVKADVEWHGPYNVAEEGPAAGHKAKMGDAANLGKAAENIGAVDYLREIHKDDPEAFIEAVTGLVAKYADKLEQNEKARPDVALNKKLRMVRTSDMSDKTDAIDIKGSEFNVLTPTSKSNKWALSAGAKNEYGGVDNGRLWFERLNHKGTVDPETGAIAPTLFNTSAARIISRMQQAKKTTERGGKAGIQDQKDMLLQGISSMLNAKMDNGDLALSGRIGIMRGGKVRWLQDGAALPKDLKINGGTLETVDQVSAREQVVKNRAELTAWLKRNKFDSFAKAAEQALETKDDALIATVLKEAVDDSGDTTDESPKSESKFYKDSKIVESVPTRGKDGKPTADGKRVNYSEHAQQYLVDTPGEELSRIETANKELEAKVRTNDELTGAELQPRATRAELDATRDKLDATLPSLKQVTWVLDALRKGVPAFNASVKELSAERVEAVRDTLTQMLAAKTAANPIWHGTPPKDMTAFGNRARVALDRLNTAKQGFVLVPSNKPAAARAVMTRQQAKESKSLTRDGDETPDDTPPKGTRASTSKKLETRDVITREMVRSEPGTMFLFGDNDSRTGLGGQARAMRGEQNAVGIRTKSAPSMAATAFWSDTTYDENIRKIDSDLAPVFAYKGKVVLPSAGLGTGLSQLKDKAPKTFAYLERQVNSLKGNTRENARNEEAPKGTKVTLPKTSPYAAKDQAKSDKANKFLGRGSDRSSTNAYAKAWGDNANTGEYEASDRVFVSVEGNRAGRIGIDLAELKKAIAAGATFITDDKANRERAYNVGEQGLAKFLANNGYTESAPGEWTKASSADKQTAAKASKSIDVAAIRQKYDSLEDENTNDVAVENELADAYAKVTAETERLLARAESFGAPYVAELRAEFEQLEGIENVTTQHDRNKYKALAGTSLGELLDLYERAQKYAQDVAKAQPSLFNKQTAENNLGTTPMTAEQQAKVRADIARRVGAQVKVEFGKIFGAPNADGLTKELSGEWTEGVIRVSINAVNPDQIGAHESMHEFFSNITKSDNKTVARVKSIMLNAATSQSVLNQLNRLLDKHPAALAQIKEGAANYEEERLAYAFQFWQAGVLNIGPETKTTFKKIADFLRKVVGMLTDDQKAEKLLEAFDRGEMRTEDAVVKALLDNIEYRERAIQGAAAVLKPVSDAVGKLVSPAQDVLMESDNPSLVAIAKMFKQPTGEGVAETEMEAKQRQMNHYMNNFVTIVKGYDAKDLSLAAEYLHAGKVPHNEAARKIYDGVQGMLKDLHKYVVAAGVKRWDAGEGDEKGKWVDLGKIKENYFPHAFDISIISADPDKFIADLIRVHSAELEAIAKSSNLEATAKNAKAKQVTVQDIAEAITNRILNSYGQQDLGETESVVGFQPHMRAVNRRTLTWLDTDALGEYMNKDLSDIMTTYIAQAVKRAEYVRRFENGGDKLQRMYVQALNFETNKMFKAKYDVELTELDSVKGGVPAFVRKSYERILDEINLKRDPNTPEVEVSDLKAIEEEALKTMERPGKAIMALEGTLGYDIDPRTRAVSGSIVAYENIRLLSTALFSQMIDPLGIIVRGGEMKHAFAAYSRGIKEVWASWTGKRNENAETQLAEFLGTVESVGYLSTFGQQYSSLFLNKKIRKINDAMFKYNGMEGFNRAARIQATQAAIEFLKRHKGLPDKASKEYLAELNLTPDDITLDENGVLNYADPKIQHAINRWVNGAVLRPNAAHRPVWMSDPHYMIFGHMKQFSYTFHDVILKRIKNDAVKFGDLGPMAVVLGTFAPMMVAADAAKALLLTGTSPTWSHDLGSIVGHGVERAGLLGMYQPVYDSTVGTHGLLSIAGPAAEQVADLFVDPIGQSFENALPGANVLHVVDPAVRGVAAEQ